MCLILHGISCLVCQVPDSYPWSSVQLSVADDRLYKPWQHTVGLFLKIKEDSNSQMTA